MFQGPPPPPVIRTSIIALLFVFGD